jgi:DNA-binding MarR family transcriptional regulator
LGRKSIVNKVSEIELNMVMVRNLFVRIFDSLVKNSTKVVDTSFSMSQMKALSAFHEDRPYSMGELSRNALVKMPSMTEMVDKLEEVGILERVRDCGDRRVVKVHLTETGKKIHQEFISRRKQEAENIFGNLDEKDQGELLNALKKVSNILNKIDAR